MVLNQSDTTTTSQFYRQDLQTIFNSKGLQALRPRINLVMAKAQFILSCAEKIYQSTLCNLQIGIRGCPSHHLPFIQQASNFLQTVEQLGASQPRGAELGAVRALHILSQKFC